MPYEKLNQALVTGFHLLPMTAGSLQTVFTFKSQKKVYKYIEQQFDLARNIYK